VILDADLAKLYGVETKAFNQAMKRNEDRFPEDFRFRVTAAEAAEILRSRSQIVTASPGASPMRSQIVTASKRDIRYLPYVFTEHGALMAANILRSDRAVEMSLYVIRAFVKLREVLAANATILKRLAEIDKALLEHDGALRDVYRKLLPLLQPLPQPPKRQIGFNR
jgi:hypothetical protein